MKAIITIIITVLFIQMSFAQDHKEVLHDAHDKSAIPNNVTHFTDQNADKFVGTWIWKNGDDLFKLVLKNDTHNFGDAQKPFILHLLKGGYIFIKNGKEIKNTINNFSITASTEGKTDSLFLLVANDKTQKSKEFILTYINNSTIKLDISKRQHEGAVFHDKDLQIPVSITLTKIN